MSIEAGARPRKAEALSARSCQCRPGQFVPGDADAGAAADTQRPHERRARRGSSGRWLRSRERHRCRRACRLG